MSVTEKNICWACHHTYVGTPGPSGKCPTCERMAPDPPLDLMAPRPSSESSKDRIGALQSLLWNVNNVRVSDAQVGNVARSFQRELISILADLNKSTSAPETRAQAPGGGAIREAQLYRALERLHYAVKNLAEAHAFDLTGPVKGDHESSLWLDLNDAQANAAQKIKHFAGPDVKAKSKCQHLPGQAEWCPKCSAQSEGTSQP